MQTRHVRHVYRRQSETTDPWWAAVREQRVPHVTRDWAWASGGVAAAGLNCGGDRDAVGDGRLAGDRRRHPGARDSDLRVRPLGELLGARRGPSCSYRRTVRPHRRAFADGGRAPAADELAVAGPAAEDSVPGRQVLESRRRHRNSRGRRRSGVYGDLSPERRHRARRHARLARRGNRAATADPSATRGLHHPDPRYLRGIWRRRILAGSVARSGYSPVQGRRRRSRRLATR